MKSVLFRLLASPERRPRFQPERRSRFQARRLQISTTFSDPLYWSDYGFSSEANARLFDFEGALDRLNTQLLGHSVTPESRDRLARLVVYAIRCKPDLCHLIGQHSPLEEIPYSYFFSLEDHTHLNINRFVEGERFREPLSLKSILGVIQRVLDTILAERTSEGSNAKEYFYHTWRNSVRLPSIESRQERLMQLIDEIDR